jgi:hypothetical protein
MKVVRSALRTGRLYLPVNIPGTYFCWRLSRPQDNSAAGRIISIKNSTDTVGDLTRDSPDCREVPQPTAPPCAPRTLVDDIKTNLTEVEWDGIDWIKLAGDRDM